MWAGRVELMRGGQAYTGVWWGKPEGKTQLGRPRSRQEDKIRTDIQEVGCGVWIGWSWLRIWTGGGMLRMPQ